MITTPPSFIDPITPVHEHMEEQGFYHTPMATRHDGSSTSSPLAAPRLLSRPRLGSQLVLNLAHRHPLQSLWTTHHNGAMSSDDGMPTTDLRYQISLRSALLDITNSIYWNETDDNGSTFDDDTEVDERQNEDDDLMVYMVETTEDNYSPVSPGTALPQVEGDPISFEEDIIAIASPLQRFCRNERSGDLMEVDESISSSEDDVEYELQRENSNGTRNAGGRIQPALSSIRYSRRLSLYEIGTTAPPRQHMEPFYRRHSMGAVTMIAV